MLKKMESLSFPVVICPRKMLGETAFTHYVMVSWNESDIFSRIVRYDPHG